MDLPKVNVNANDTDYICSEPEMAIMKYVDCLVDIYFSTLLFKQTPPTWKWE